MKALNFTSGILNNFENHYGQIELYAYGSNEVYELLKNEASPEMLENDEFWCAKFDFENKTYAIMGAGELTSSGEYLLAELNERVAKLDLTQLEDLIIEAEGVAWQGWFCEVFASIDSDGDVSLSLGSPMSNGYTPCDNVVGKVDCWFRRFKEDDAREWASECNADESEFDSDDCMKHEASELYSKTTDGICLDDVDLDSLNTDFKPETIIDNIAYYLKSEGYSKLVITNY